VYNHPHGMTSSGVTAGERRLVAALGMLAAVNLAIAIFVIATEPQRALDLLSVRAWCADWLRHGRDLFALVDPDSDYPPNAIVTLSPIALIPRRWLVPAWTMFALALAPALPFVVTRAAGLRARGAVLVTVTAFLCWASARTLLQFSVLSMTLAFGALAMADAEPVASGVLLGLALAKPHIAGPVALWAILAGRARLVVATLATLVVAFLVYCARARVAPLPVVAGYWTMLARTYGGADGLTGVTSLRHWMPSDAAWMMSACALLAVVVATAARWRNAGGAGRLVAPACASLWSLLVFYHNSNNLILLLPSFVFLLAAGHRAIAAILQIALMIDIPYRLAPVLSPGLAHDVVTNANRILVITAFAWVTATAWRRDPAI
jgi:hypothetical protein